MKSLRSKVIVLAWAIFVLMIAQTAAAGNRRDGGGGGRGSALSVSINGVLLINQRNGATLAEISGVGFLSGSGPSVSLDDGTALTVREASRTMIVASIPRKTADGEYMLTVSTGDLMQHA